MPYARSLPAPAPFTQLTRVFASDELYPHPEHLVPFVGNHDQSRIAQDVADPAMRALAYGLLFTTRGTPQFYYGDELGMRGGNDPDNRDDFPGGFSAMAPGAFTAAARTPAQQQEFLTVQRLLSLRNTHPALQTGTEQILEAGVDTLVYVRTLPGEQVRVALNKGKVAQTLHIDLAGTAAAAARKSSSLLGPCVCCHSYFRPAYAHACACLRTSRKA